MQIFTIIYYYLQVNCAYKFIGKQIKDNFGENAFETDEK